MEILHLAPHPFYQDRGTPIDDLLVLQVLNERQETHIDLLVYNEGKDIELNNVNLHRIPDMRFLRNIRPGFSLKKLFCDVLFFFKACRLVKDKNYDLIHAGEEAVFMAMFFKLLYKIPYVYDLDSSIAQQLVEKKPYLKCFSRIFNWFEGQAIRHSLANLPVCNALAELCKKNGSKKTVTIHDISQLKNPNAPKTGKLQEKFGLNGLILLYIGNLEPYQGIDLLLESFHVACKETDKVTLIVIGGIPEDICTYKRKASQLGIEEKVFFLGPKPLSMLDEYLAEGDILVVPRIRGINTPMKIFPYLHSGKAVLVTDLPTHSQILTKNEAYLAPANPIEFAEGIIALSKNDTLRAKLGENGYKFVEKNHTYSVHQRRLHGAYDWVEKELKNGISNHNFERILV
ncbi:MAG: glycosyltransferase [Candidatus Scalindua sp. AMX11]|nr:MAG: glycosyltransferase [Candidatus Scalindua sp.]NOG82683.1 glycosyltransferase [Planctomycetota bacterium]RZV95257.1 MAG: glycosyltransferase [Candidatus Scalindua sp. SCAELEC01]TDE66263.1 MAG: glycosyltransferase [Candidatus Scalindua sp. AMX11]GJQ57886.1 MAG: glycoside hydrolase [Candidatus Scalindua sp.]